MDDEAINCHHIHDTTELEVGVVLQPNQKRIPHLYKYIYIVVSAYLLGPDTRDSVQQLLISPNSHVGVVLLFPFQIMFSLLFSYFCLLELISISH